MTSVGIVAEFNPFHNGHSYLIQKAKELTGADCAVVVMSGDFVQRGECAVFDKYFRAKCALLGGADLVVMLPVNISTASSETFAAGAVRILAKLGVNFIAFGCETVTNDTLDELSSLAAFLNNEPSDFKNNLSSHLKSGLTYPKARRLAMSESFDDSVLRYLDTPNNLLAIDYIRALQKYKLSMKPVPIQRLGDEYHATSTKLFMSSTAIREYLKCNNYSSCNLSPEILERISDDAAGKLPLFSNDCTRLSEHFLMRQPDGILLCNTVCFIKLLLNPLGECRILCNAHQNHCAVAVFRQIDRMPVIDRRLNFRKMIAQIRYRSNVDHSDHSFPYLYFIIILLECQ